MKAFRAKFEYKLKYLRETFEGKLNDMRKYNREQFKISDQRLDRLDSAIDKEIQDRIDETDEQINETQTVLTSKSQKSV